MILQPASRKELKRIAVGSAVCAVLEIALFWLLGIFGIGRFSYRIVTGTLGGTLMGILNFALMCLMIQNATGITDEKLMKAKVRGSYNLRKIIQILCSRLPDSRHQRSGCRHSAVFPQCGDLLPAVSGKTFPERRSDSKSRSCTCASGA